MTEAKPEVHQHYCFIAGTDSYCCDAACGNPCPDCPDESHLTAPLRQEGQEAQPPTPPLDVDGVDRLATLDKITLATRLLRAEAENESLRTECEAWCSKAEDGAIDAALLAELKAENESLKARLRQNDEWWTRECQRIGVDGLIADAEGDPFYLRNTRAEASTQELARLRDKAEAENESLKAELREITKNRDQWERNSAAENKRAGDAL